MGPAAESTRTAELDNRGILQLQQELMSEQDEELAELEKSVTSTRVRCWLIQDDLEVCCAVAVEDSRSCLPTQSFQVDIYPGDSKPGTQPRGWARPTPN